MARKKEGVLITSAILRRAGACQGFCRTFRRRYPKGVRVTQEEAERLANSRMFACLIGVGAKRLLTGDGFKIWLTQSNAVEALVRCTNYLSPRRFGLSRAAFNVARASIFADLLLDPDYRNPVVY